MTQDEANPRTLPVMRAAALVLLGGFALYLSVRHYIRPLSDPANWWHYARNLSTEFPSSKWPVAYPAFLALVRRLAGDGAALLSNIPLLVALAAAGGALAQRSARAGGRRGGDEGARGEESAAGVLTMAALLAACGPTLLDVVSPYRDPLALLLQTGSLLLTVRCVRAGTAPRLGVGLAGVLLGLAASVREPSILTAGPVALYGAVVLRRAGWPARWAAAWRFGLGVLVGLLPLLVQTAWATRQFVLPPQSVAEGHWVPGMEVSLAGQTFGRAVEFYRRDAWFFILALLGVVRGAHRRNAAVLTLLLPTAIVFAAFYACYWIFVPRYFLAAMIPAAALAGYGGAGVCAAVASRPRTRAAAFALPALAAAAALAWLWWPSPGGRTTRFRLANLRALSAQVATAVPPGSTVFAPRPWCDVFRFAGIADSRSLAAARAPDVDADADAGRAVMARLAAGRPVFCADGGTPEAPGADMLLALRHVAAAPALSLDPRALHLLEWMPDRPLALYRLMPRTQLTESASVTVPAGATRPVLCVAIAGPATQATLTVRAGGHATEHRLAAGTHHIALGSATGRVDATLSADAPVGWGIPPRVVSADEPLELDFGPAAPLPCDRYLTEGFAAAPDLRVRELRQRGQIRLPALWPDDAWLGATLLCNGFSADGVWPILDVSAGGTSVLRRAVTRGVSFAPAVFWLPPGSHGGLDAQVLGAVPPFQRGILVDRLTVQPLQPAESATVDIGSDGDILWLIDGFHQRERGPAGRSVRWSGAQAAVRFLMAPGGGAYRLRVAACPQSRPPDRAPDPRFVWNGEALSGVRPDGDGGWDADIPAGGVRAGENRFVLQCRAWRPADAGSRDTRELGLMVDSISLTSSPGVRGRGEP